MMGKCTIIVITLFLLSNIAADAYAQSNNRAKQLYGALDFKLMQQELSRPAREMQQNMRQAYSKKEEQKQQIRRRSDELRGRGKRMPSFASKTQEESRFAGLPRSFNPEALDREATKKRGITLNSRNLEAAAKQNPDLITGAQSKRLGGNSQRRLSRYGTRLSTDKRKYASEMPSQKQRVFRGNIKRRPTNRDVGYFGRTIEK